MADCKKRNWERLRFGGLGEVEPGSVRKAGRRKDEILISIAESNVL